MEDFWIWVILWWMLIVGIWLWARKIGREVKQAEQDVEALFNKIIFMKTEQHDNKIFAYDAVTNEFICQGINMEELNKNFGIRYPTRKGILVEDNKEPANVL